MTPQKQTTPELTARPTRAQIAYLKRAINIEGAAPRRCGVSGIYWSLWAPGSTATGRACLRHGWIVPAPGSAGWPYVVTNEGRRVAEAAA